MVLPSKRNTLFWFYRSRSEPGTLVFLTRGLRKDDPLSYKTCCFHAETVHDPTFKDFSLLHVCIHRLSTLITKQTTSNIFSLFIIYTWQYHFPMIHSLIYACILQINLMYTIESTRFRLGLGWQNDARGLYQLTLSLSSLLRDLLLAELPIVASFFASCVFCRCAFIT